MARYKRSGNYTGECPARTGLEAGPVMPNDGLAGEDLAEIIRKKQRYRELILSGKLILPHDRAAQLVGPDCVYRLYSLPGSGDPRPAGRRKSAGQTAVTREARRKAM